MKKTLAVCSGGLDSVTLAYEIASHHHLEALVSFDYGQKHKKELFYAQKVAKHFNVNHHVIDIRSVGQCLKSSLIQSTNNVPEGHYTATNMSSTVVPNRNAIMLTIAFGLADSINVDSVALAVHGGDHFIYPDCRPEFIEAFSNMQQLALGKTPYIELYVPYLNKTKGQIALLSSEYCVPIQDTWSCYKGGDIHCGRCGTCVERLEALAFANIKDRTPYLDSNFWKSTLPNTEK